MKCFEIFCQLQKTERKTTNTGLKKLPVLSDQPHHIRALIKLYFTINISKVGRNLQEKKNKYHLLQIRLTHLNLISAFL